MVSWLLTWTLLVATGCHGALGGLGTQGAQTPVCQFHPLCTCDRPLEEISCRNAGFEQIPPLPSSVIKLDLSTNNITELNEMSFADLSDLEELMLADNQLERIHPRAFAFNTKLKRLSLQNCGLAEIPVEALRSLTQLTTLQLDGNQLGRLEADSFQGLGQLRSLRLEGNRLETVPTEALLPLTLLEALNLGSNQLTSLPSNSFPEMRNLVILLIKKNRISEIDDDAFSNLTSLRVLELDDNQLTNIPLALTKLSALQELSVSGNRIKYIPAGILQHSRGLALLELKGNPLVGVDPHAFSFLPKLRKLILSDARELSKFPSLNGTSALEVLRLDRASLHSVPATLCHTCPRLKSLLILRA